MQETHKHKACSTLALACFVFITAARGISSAGISFQLMEDLGSASDKVYSHGYHRFYPGLFRQHNLSRDAEFKMLEIGFGQGNSVALWESLFPKADIIWIDYSTPAPKERLACVPGLSACRTGERSQYYFGDQANATFLQTVMSEVCGAAPCLDLIIDDGGHGYVQQLVSFRVLFEHALKPGGLYAIEDIETSYWTHGEQYGDLTIGGRLATHTPVAVWKSIVDKLNAEYHDKEFVADIRLGNKVESLIRSISFSANMLTATKKDDYDLGFDSTVVDKRLYRFRHRVEGWFGSSQETTTLQKHIAGTGTQKIDFDRCIERSHRMPKRGKSVSVNIFDKDAVMLFEDLCQLQFGACHLGKGSNLQSGNNGKAVLYSVMGDGIGSGMHLLGHALSFALADGRQLVEDIGHFVDLDDTTAVGFSHYYGEKSPCGDGVGVKWGLECYFAPLSSCSNPRDFSRSRYKQSFRAALPAWNVDEVLRKERETKEDQTKNAERTHVQTVRAAWVPFRNVQRHHGWKTVQNFMPSSYKHRSLLWFKSHIMWFLMQPSSRVFDAVQKTSHQIGISRIRSDARVVAMHVRRGDKATDPIMVARREAAKREGKMLHEVATLDKYVTAARRLAAVHFPPGEPLRILLVTEDAGVVAETAKFHDVKWYYTKDHDRQNEPMKIKHAIEAGLTTGDQEMMIALRNLYMSVYYCQAFVGTFTSNWSRLTYELMYAYMGREPPAMSLDSEWYP